MASSRAKFTLKPSSLSQHTANFNKILEQVPVPKLESLNIIKPLDKIILTTDNDTNSISQLAKKENENDSSQANKDDSSSTSTTNATTTTTTSNIANSKSTSQFVFGEQLNDRVINAVTSENSNEENQTNGTSENTTTTTTATTTSLWPANTDASNALDAEKYTLDESDSNTIVKFNCKLFLLDSDKANWTERGYGILKLIEPNDGKTCKMMMWTDKTYRLILNSKIFDKMQIDRANKKSIRFNAFDNGAIRIFLIKTANQNDCDELFDLVEHRISLVKENSELSDKTNTDLSLKENLKKFIFSCSCEIFSKAVDNDNNAEDSQISKDCKLQLYTYPEMDKSNKNLKYESHQLLLDVLDSYQEDASILLTTYLKFIRIKSSSLSSSSANKSKSLEFELDESMLIKSTLNKKVGNKLVYRVVINDKDSWDELMSLYDKEPKFCPDDSSNETSSSDSEDDNESADDGDDDSNESNADSENNFKRETKRRRKRLNDESLNDSSSSQQQNHDSDSNRKRRNNNQYDGGDDESNTTSDSNTNQANKRDIDENSSNNEIEVKKPKVEESK